MKRLLLSLALMAMVQSAFAYHFSAIAPSGQTLYYDFFYIDSNSVAIVYPGNYNNPWSGYSKPTGHLIIPDSVTYLGHTYAVKQISTRSFWECDSLTNVIIPNTIQYIRSRAFWYCTGLDSITIPNSVTEIGGGTFMGCIGLQTVNYDIDSVILPSWGTSGYIHPFQGCTNVSTINFGNNVRIIPDSICIPFLGLLSVNIGNSVTTIGNYAFGGCTGLQQITIPTSVTSIGNYAFLNCSGLHSLSIPNSVDTVGSSAFNGCSSLDTITIHGSIRIIPDMAFKNCTNLSYIVIPNSVTGIGCEAFYGCSSLESIVIPNSVSWLGQFVFSYCSGLYTITVRRSMPPTLANHPSFPTPCTFYNCPANIIIHVPCEASSNYISTVGWGDFSNYVEDCVSINVTPNNYTLGGVTGGGTYNTGDTVTLTAIPFPGSHFVGWSNGSQENPLTFIATTNASHVAAFAVDSLPQDTVYIHDTTYITLAEHDTVFVNHYVHDTLINYIHDTTFINNYIHDTLFYPVYIHDTTIVNHIVYDTVYFHDTIYRDRYIHDTIYVHDTIYIQEGEGIDNITQLNAKIYQRNGMIVVEGAEGNPVYLYDVVGRVLATRRETMQEVLLDVPASGVYLVKIGDVPARRIVVKR